MHLYGPKQLSEWQVYGRTSLSSAVLRRSIMILIMDKRKDVFTEISLRYFIDSISAISYSHRVKVG